jgi:hypothetical protein
VDADDVAGARVGSAAGMLRGPKAQRYRAPMATRARRLPRARLPRRLPRTGEQPCSPQKSPLRPSCACASCPCAPRTPLPPTNRLSAQARRRNRAVHTRTARPSAAGSPPSPCTLAALLLSAPVGAAFVPLLCLSQPVPSRPPPEELPVSTVTNLGTTN